MFKYSYLGSFILVIVFSAFFGYATHNLDQDTIESTMGMIIGYLFVIFNIGNFVAFAAREAFPKPSHFKSHSVDLIVLALVSIIVLMVIPNININEMQSEFPYRPGSYLFILPAVISLTLIFKYRNLISHNTNSNENLSEEITKRP